MPVFPPPGSNTAIYGTSSITYSATQGNLPGTIDVSWNIDTVGGAYEVTAVMIYYATFDFTGDLQNSNVTYVDVGISATGLYQISNLDTTGSQTYYIIITYGYMQTLTNPQPGLFTSSTETPYLSLSAKSSSGGGAVCFLGNAPVLTPVGYRRIDSLAVGDMVRTADGRDVAIQRVKHQRVVTPSAAVNPFVIPRGQFGATENLAISPRHAVAVPGRGMVEARELGLRQLSMKAAFDYYNLELPEWDNMIVAGVEVESLAPKKRVVMTAAEFRGFVASMGRTMDLAKLAQFAAVRADGSVDVMLTRKERRRMA